MGNKRDHALSAIESIDYNTEPYSCLGKAAIGGGGIQEGDTRGPGSLKLSSILHIGQPLKAYILL